MFHNSEQNFKKTQTIIFRNYWSAARSWTLSSLWRSGRTRWRYSVINCETKRKITDSELWTTILEINSIVFVTQVFEISHRRRHDVVDESKGNRGRDEVPHWKSSGATASKNSGETLLENVQNSLKTIMTVKDIARYNIFDCCLVKLIIKCFQFKTSLSFVQLPSFSMIMKNVWKFNVF